MTQPQSIFWCARNPSQAVDGYLVRFWQKTIYLGGTVHSRSEAEELVAAINALKAMLPEKAGDDMVPTNPASASSRSMGRNEKGRQHPEGH